jgi:hypothetical protein
MREYMAEFTHSRTLKSVAPNAACSWTTHIRTKKCSHLIPRTAAFCSSKFTLSV